MKIYNPEGSLLRKDQKELVLMLEAFDAICKEHNIQWWLCSGTLLGAARHQGFIPWDDDLDIALLKKDYIRLEKILCEMKSDEFVFHCMKSDPDYVYWFGKFRKKQGSIQSSNKRTSYYKWKGIGFDIFTIEKSNLLSAKLASLSYDMFQRHSIKIANSLLRKSYIRVIEYLHKFVIFPLLHLIGLYNPNHEYHYSLGIGWPNCTFDINDIFPLSTISFEGKQMPCPRNVDTYLTNIYGNWRKLPSEEEIKHSIHCQEYRDEIFGKEK